MTGWPIPASSLPSCRRLPIQLARPPATLLVTMAPLLISCKPVLPLRPAVLLSAPRSKFSPAYKEPPRNGRLFFRSSPGWRREKCRAKSSIVNLIKKPRKTVIPVKTGIQMPRLRHHRFYTAPMALCWIPAFAGMTLTIDDFALGRNAVPLAMTARLIFTIRRI